MAPSIDNEDLIDAGGTAELLGLEQSNSVNTYQKRYRDVPRPVVDLGAGRPRLWARKEIVPWVEATGRLPG